MKPTEQTARIPSPRTGILATLRTSLSAKGTGAPSLPRPRPTRTRPLLASAPLALSAALCALAFTATPAAATPAEFGSFGSGAGQFSSPLGVGVNQATGDVYIADNGNQRVDEFTKEGGFLQAFGWGVADGTTQALQTCTTTCFAGLPGTGAGQLNGPQGIAVDNSLSLSQGDVYVDDTENNRVDKFGPEGEFLLMFGGEVNETKTLEFNEPGDPHAITKAEENVCLLGENCRAGVEGTEDGQFHSERSIAVGPSGNVYVGGGSRVQVFNPAGEYQSQVAIPEGGSTKGLAVDSAGDMYVISQEDALGVRKFSPSGVLLQTLDAGGEPVALTLDAAGNVFVDDVFPASTDSRLLEYDPAGVQLAAFDHNVQHRAFGGIAFSVPAGGLYLLNENREVSPPTTRVLFLAPPEPGPSLLPGSESATEVFPTSVLLGATVNAEGNPTKYRFQYGTSSSYSASLPVPEGDMGSGFEEHEVSVKVPGLTPSTVYHFRIVASNECETGRTCTVTGPDQTFTTLPPALIDSESVSDVSASSATLQGTIDPLGSDTLYHFSYGPTAACGGTECSVPVPDGDIGAGVGPVTVSQHIQGLTAATVYHYRIVASNALSNALGAPVEGETRTFTTQSAGPLVLADGRQWELVSPANKLGSRILPDVVAEHALQASASGDALAYVATVPLEAKPVGFTGAHNVLSTRGARGWSSRDLEIPHTEPTGTSGFALGDEFQLFSSDLSRTVLQPWGGFLPSISPEASEQTPYLAVNFAPGAASAGCGESCYHPLVTGKPGYANVPEEIHFSTTGECTEPTGHPFRCGPRFEGASTDFAHVVMASNSGLTTTSTSGESALYEWTAGAAIRLVSVLPANEGGEPVTALLGDVELTDSNSGTAGRTATAVSQDGTRIVWTAQGSISGCACAGHLYESDTAGPTTTSVRLDAGLAGSSEFEAASADGKTIIFRNLVSSHEANLYEYHVGAGLEALTTEGGALASILGSSEDGSRVFFASTVPIANVPGGVANAPNLYEHSAAGTRLVSVLSTGDRPDWGNRGGENGEPPEVKESFETFSVTARVSPDGHWLTFMSARSLTGFDNRDAVTGRPDEEVYLFDTATRALRCVSCNPTGARPHGVVEPSRSSSLALGADGIWIGHSVAANVPGWTLAGYQPRYLSNSGRVFFNSSDALVPQDVNGTQDVYQWEPSGSGGCVPGGAGFSQLTDGCVALMSGGQGPQESAFVDASESGGDVFFMTSVQLVSADVDHSYDMYDAHECTPAVPCLPGSAASPPPCATADACRLAPSVQPGVFGAPASATLSRSGNLTPQPPPVAKPLTNAQKLTKALKACRKQKIRRKRRSCEKQAHKRYGAKAARFAHRNRRAR